MIVRRAPRVLAVAAVCAGAAGTAVSSAPAIAPVVDAAGQHEVAHGGGCRKSSPPGQCCHLQKSTGTVHCH